MNFEREVLVAEITDNCLGRVFKCENFDNAVNKIIKLLQEEVFTEEGDGDAPHSDTAYNEIAGNLGFHCNDCEVHFCIGEIEDNTTY